MELVRLSVLLLWAYAWVHEGFGVCFHWRQDHGYQVGNLHWRVAIRVYFLPSTRNFRGFVL